MQKELVEKDAEIKPCPFCGEKEFEHLHIESLGDGHYLVCLRCGARSGMWDGIEDVIASWNTRTSDAEIKRLRAEFFCPNAVYEAAIQAYATANESGCCPDHCVAMACEVVWQAATSNTADSDVVERMASEMQKLRNLIAITPQSYIELAEQYTPGLAECIKSIAAMQAPVGVYE